MLFASLQYYCDPDNIDYLSDVDELETCAYTLVVYTNKICHHPYLKPPRRTKSVPITCHPLLTEDEYREYEEIKGIFLFITSVTLLLCILRVFPWSNW